MKFHETMDVLTRNTWSTAMPIDGVVHLRWMDSSADRELADRLVAERVASLPQTT